MATTRLESGRMQLAQVGGVPMQQVQLRGVDYVGAQAESQVAKTMGQILDRMSSSLFEQAGKMRQAEGLEFVATNPITQEQLEAAKNGDVSNLDFSKNPLSIYGQAVKKARSLELSSHFEIEGRNELTKLLAGIEDGSITPTDTKSISQVVEEKIATVTQGFAKSLAAIDGEAAYKFRATMATHGNTVLSAAYQTELKRAKAQRMAKFDMDFDNGVRLLEATIAQGFYIDPKTGEKKSIDDMVDVFRKTTLNQSLLLGDVALQKEYSTKFENALRGAKVSAITKELVTNDVYMANPVETLNRIRRGDIGNMSPVLQQMIANDFEGVAKVTANFMVAVNQRESAAKDIEAATKREGEKRAFDLLEQIFPLPEGSPKRKALVAQLNALPPGSVPIGTLKDLLDPGKEGNPAVEFNALNAIYQGTLTTPEQINEMPGLNGQQKLRLLKTLTSEDRRDQRELDTGLARLAGIPTMPGAVTVIDPKGTEFKRLQSLRADAQQIQAEATRDGKVMTTRQVLSELETRLEAKRNTEEAKAAKTALATYEKQDWINGPINRETLPALEKKAGNDKKKQQQLKRIKSLLDQAEGNQ